MNLSVTIDDGTLFLIHDLEDGRPIGTGFAFIKPEWVVTAKHVAVKNNVPRSHLFLQAYQENPVEASVLLVHPTHDLAVIRLEGVSPCRIPLFPSYEGSVGSKGFFCCGYAPSQSDADKKQLPIYINHVVAYEREQRSRKEGDEDIIIFEAPYVEGGHSGGPLLGEGGGVVAVVVEQFNRNGRLHGRATSILSLLDFLEFRKECEFPVADQAHSLT